MQIKYNVVNNYKANDKLREPKAIWKDNSV